MPARWALRGAVGCVGSVRAANDTQVGYLLSGSANETLNYGTPEEFGANHRKDGEDVHGRLVGEEEHEDDFGVYEDADY